MKDVLEKKLSKPFPVKSIMDRMRFIDESSRKTSAYSDPTYIPFYYYLGEIIKPEHFCEIGLGLGLFSSAFFKSCKSVKYFLAFQDKPEEGYIPSLAIKNVKDNYKGEMDFYLGDIMDDVFFDKISPKKWDLLIINNDRANFDKYLMYLEYFWPYINLNGYIVMDYINSHRFAGEAFYGFAKIKNREPDLFRTRYGTGIIKK